MEAEAQEKIAVVDSAVASRMSALRVVASEAEAIVSTWWAAALALLLVAASVDKYTLDVAGLHIKLEHFVIAGLLVVLIVVTIGRVIRHEASISLRGLALWPLTWIVPYIGVMLLSSFVNAPNVAESLRHTAMVGLVASGAWVAYWLANTGRLLELGVRMLVGLGLLEASYTFFVLVASRFGSTLGTQPGNGDIVVPYGTLWEPNLLGSYLAAAGVLLLSLLFVSKERKTQIAMSAALFLIVAALGLSLARAAWVGFFVGGLVVICLYFWVGRQKDHPRMPVEWRRILATLAVPVLGAALFLGVLAPILFPDTFRGIFVRLNPQWYDAAKDPAVQIRVTTTQGALDGITSHPIIGNGAGSFGMTHMNGRGAPEWVSNLELHILYDSGAIGLALFVLGLVLLAWKALQAIHVQPDSDDKIDLRPQIIGLLGALSVLLFTFQSTEGTWMAFFWVYVGLIGRVGAWRKT